MSGAEQYGSCWRPGQGRLVVADVAAQSEQVMLAVHQPQSMLSLPVLERGMPASDVDSHELPQDGLLEHLLTGESPEGTLIVPIIGAPGTGKSHLIRWLAAAIPDRDDLVVRHVPRERTSLPNVIEILFEGAEGPAFDRLRDDLANARRDWGELQPAHQMEQVAVRLLSRIAEVLQFWSSSNTPWRAAADVDAETREALCGEDVLPTLLVDAVIRKQLTRPDGAVYRLARDIVEGQQRADDDEDQGLGFLPEDLEFSQRRGMGQYAMRALRNLQMPGYKEASAKVLTDALDHAANAVMGLSTVSLTGLLAQLRRELHAEGKQLVLLFEDIAIARGLQLDLVDALTTAARRPGEPELCPLRVAMAVTRDYWLTQAPATLSSRAQLWQARMMDLDTPSGEALERAPELIGRYLNAARIGVETLQAMPLQEIQAGVPNACDACAIRPTCHGLFGATSAGHGLFPLTATAAERLPRIADPAGRPRPVLGSVVAPVLADAEALADGRFPSSSVLQTLVTAAVAEGRLEEMPIEWTEAVEHAGLSGEAREQATTVLRAWLGDAEPPAVLEVLGLPPTLLANAPRRATAPRATEPAAGRGRKERERREPVRDDRRDQLDAWANNTIELTQAMARDVRNAAWAALQGGIRWDELALNRTAALGLLGITATGPQLQNATIHIIKGGGGGGLTASRAPLHEFAPSAANARLMRALVRWKAHGEQFDYAGAAEDLARIRTFIQAVERDVEVRLQAVGDRRRTTDEARLVVLAAAPLAGVDAPSKLTLGAALPEFEDAEDHTRSPAWRAYVKKARESHKTARAFVRGSATRSQGETGDPTVLDVGAIDVAAVDAQATAVDRVPKTVDVAQRFVALRSEAEAAVEAEAREVEAAVRQIRGVIGTEGGLPLQRIRDAVTEAMAAARSAELLRPQADVALVEAADLPAAGRAAQVLEDAEVAVRAAGRERLIEAVVRLAKVDRALLGVLADYLTRANTVVDASTDAARAALRQRRGQDADEHSGEVQSTIDALLSFCEELA